MKKWIKLLAIFLGGGILIALLLSLSAPESSDERSRPFSITTTSTTASQVVSLTLHNRSTEIVCSVYIASADATEWGSNLLDVGNIVGPGESRTFEVRSGTHNLRADNCFDVPLAREMAVEVNGPISWEITTEK